MRTFNPAIPGFGTARSVCRLGLLLVFLLSSLMGLQAASFMATLDRNSIAVGESATLSLTFQGGEPSTMPNVQVPNLSIQSLGRSSQFSLFNGQMSSSVSFNFQVTASRPGDYVIPAIQVKVDGQTLSSQSLTLRVTKSSGGTGLAFLKLVLSKETVYVGEVFPMEVQLYLGARHDSLQMPQIEGDGFIFGKMGQPTQGNTQVGNQMYTVGTFRLSAVAVKTGTLTLGPAQCSLVLHVPMNTRGRSIFDDFFGGAQRKAVTLSSEPQNVTVLPLPKENRPPDFNGAVGNFSIISRATPTNVTAGDPITLTLQISGQGNLESLPFPGGTDWPEFKLYPPTSKTELSDNLGIAGVKTFERVVIPQTPEVKEVPAVAFSFFDPQQKTYRTVRTASVPLSVRPNEARPSEPTVLANSKQAEEPTPATRDIVHIKPYLGTIIGVETPLVLRPWFLALQGVPLVAWLSAFVWRKRREALANNPRLRRRRAVAETVRNGLKELSVIAEKRDSDAFFGTVFRLLQEQLGERLDMPASAITEAILDERVRGRGPDELIAELHELFQACNQARYAPQHSSQQLKAIVPKVEAALHGLQNLPDLSR